MKHSAAFEADYQGEQAIWLQFGSYEAVVLPEIGANLIAFRDRDKGYRFLHEPELAEMESFKHRAFIHGIPVLFPPNRYEDGKFPWNDQTYQFPVNEPQTGNHLHGFLYDQPWDVEHFDSHAFESSVSLVFRATQAHSIYTYFPHEFTIKLTYRLSDSGLQQQVSVQNHGHAPMPCLLAFHTAINAPFAKGSTSEDYRVRYTLGERWELNERMLPTGKYQEMNHDEARLKQRVGVSPYFEKMDHHYTARPENGRNRMELTDDKEHVTLIYDVGTSYKQWMIWNNDCQSGFFCAEPQMNLVNAPNVHMDPNEIGLISLHQHEIWEETSRIYCIPAVNRV